MINVFQPSLGKEELAAVEEVFKSNWVGKGKKTDQFEQDFANHIGANRGLVRSISTGTEGLFQSMKLLSMGPGDEVVLPTISFVGAANAIVDCGASPIFCDVDPRTLNPTASYIEDRITARTKAVIVLHYGGVPCEMDDILAVCKRHSLYLIEDCACAVSSLYKDQACGTFGDVSIWSFDSMKVLVTGDGGMVYCRTPEMAKQLDKQIYFGLSEQSGMSNPTDDRWWEFDVTVPSRRAVINDITAAIGIEQLKKLRDMVAVRAMVHSVYDHELKGTDLLLPPPISNHMRSTHYLYWIQHPQRNALAKFLRERGVYTTFRYYPLHRVPFYHATGKFPMADLAADTTLCLPMHSSLRWWGIKEVIDLTKEFLR